jgi:hypothetical protein
MKKALIFASISVFLIAACTQAEAPTPASLPDPTEAPAAEPTDTAPPPPPEPTSTKPPPTPTDLPKGVLFRDDFEGSLQPGWTWINEDPSRWSFVENGWLEIVGGDTSFFMEGDFGLENFLTRDVPEGEFVITAHIQADPDENFEQATIYIFENQDNYIALNLGFCSVCSTGGPGFYMETYIDHNPFGNVYHIKRDAAATDVTLKLVNQAGSLTGYYALPGEDWQKAGAFGNFFDFTSVGLGATNSNPDGVETGIVARFDYFEISQP